MPGVSTWWQRLVAVVAVVSLTAANLRGITRTARVALGLLVLTLLTVGVALAVCFGSGVRAPEPWGEPGIGGRDALGALQAAGLLFFAFAGYARIATLAEEVRRPQMLGRAILIALGTAMVVSSMVGLALLLALLLVLGDDLPGAATSVPEHAQLAIAAAIWCWQIEAFTGLGAPATLLEDIYRELRDQA